MSLWRDARWRSVTAIVLMVTMAVALHGAVLHGGSHDEADGHAGVGYAVAHDAAAHAFTAPAESDQVPPLHCLACHWTRSFRPRGDATYLAAPAVEAGTPLYVEAASHTSPSTLSQPPLRSPPSVSPATL